MSCKQARLFIWNILKEPFDYTEWQKEYFKNVSLEYFNKKAAEYDKRYPIRVKQKV